MGTSEYAYDMTEVLCGDLKIIFITDEKTPVSGSVDIHMHSFWELFFLREGALTLSAETAQYVLSREQCLLVPPNHYHNTVYSPDAVKKSVFFTYEKVKSSEKDSLFAKFHAVFSARGFCKPENPLQIGELLDTVLENQAADRIGRSWRLQAAITQLMFCLYDSLEKELPPAAEEPFSQSTYWVYKYAIDRLFDIHYMTDITLEQFSEKLFVSPQTVTRIISAAYGKSFNELKLELKMRNAKRMLRETALSVSQIGQRVGYSTARGFLAAFQRYEGCTPTEYRKRTAEEQVLSQNDYMGAPLLR